MAILKSFKIKGAMGLYYGLGVDEIHIDFEDISGLVALVGGNGLGKTTIMEMLSPYVFFPSHKSSKNNVKKQFRLRDSYKEVVYLHEGYEYAFRLEIPAGTKTASAEGYINYGLPGEEKKPLVKGKISEYKKKVVELFGSQELFYSSYFSCQNGEKLTDKTVGEFKQLLIELLGLMKYVGWWKNVGKVITAVTAELEKALKGLELFDDKIKEVETFKAEIDPLNEEIVKSKQDQEEKKVIISGLETEIKNLQTGKVEAEKLEALTEEKKKQKTAFETELTELEREHDHAVNMNAAWIGDKNNEIEPYKKVVEHEEKILAADQGIKDAEEEKTDFLGKIEAVAKHIEIKQQAIDSYTKEITDFTQQILDLNADEELKQFTENKAKLSEIYTAAVKTYNGKVSAMVAANDDSPLKTLEATLDQYKNAEALLDQRPDACAIDDCPFIMSALNSIKLKPETEKAIKTWKDNNKILVEAAQKEVNLVHEDLEDITDKGKTAAEKLDGRAKIISGAIEDIDINKLIGEKAKTILSGEMVKIKAEKTAFNDLLEKIPERIKALQALADLKPKLETAKTMIEAAKKAIAENDKESDTLTEAFQKNKSGKTDKINLLDVDIIAADLKMGSEVIQINIGRKETLLKDTKASQDKVALERTEAEKKVAVLEDKSKLSDADNEKIETLKKKEQLIRQELKKWDYIRAALSKSGLQALEIASAAPLYTGIANDILHSTFGGEFYVDLLTEDPEGHEILEIMITREDGESFPLAEYSGGESVWVLQAFKAAQILVNTEKSGIHFMTAFCDEETGALDKEKAEKFIMMYRALMEKGGFEKLFYISHLPDCQAMSDHQLVFEKGGIEVR